MKERPIIFSSEMVRAILDGKKTQTRRVIKSQINCNRVYHAEQDRWLFYDISNDSYDLELDIKCPYGKPGDKLWCKETFVRQYTGFDYGIIYKADGIKISEDMKWSPSIYMPRWASRIILEITGIRVERIQDITEEDAKAEGCEIGHGLTDDSPFFAREAFQKLWDSINAKRGYGWYENPWVWVIEFKVI